MNESVKVKRKMGFTKKIKLKVLVIMHGMSDDLYEILTLKDFHGLIKYHKKSKFNEQCRSEEYFRKEFGNNSSEKQKTNDIGVMNGLTTDAIPTKKTSLSSPESCESSRSSALYDDLNDNLEDKTFEPGHSSSPPLPDNFPKKLLAHLSNETLNGESDQNDVPEPGKGKSKKENKKKSKNSRPNSMEHDKNVAYSAFSNTYNIINSKDIHIGPTYTSITEQRVMVNGSESNGNLKKQKSVMETKEIKAVMCSRDRLTPDLIDFIADHIGHSWKTLGRKLGYSDGRLDHFEIDYHRQKERVYQLIQDWTKFRPDSATCGKLSQTLWEIDEREAVEQFANHVSKGGQEDDWCN